MKTYLVETKTKKHLIGATAFGVFDIADNEKFYSRDKPWTDD